MLRALAFAFALAAGPAWGSCAASQEVLKTFLAAGIDTYTGSVATARAAVGALDIEIASLKAQATSLTAQVVTLTQALQKCKETPPPPPPPPPAGQCNDLNLTATVGQPVSLALTCNQATTSVAWSFTSGPTSPPNPPVPSGQAAIATFPAEGTYVYSVAPTPAAVPPTPATVTIVVSTAQGPPPGNTVISNGVFCSSMVAKYGGAVKRCNDFTSSEEGWSKGPGSANNYSLYDPTYTATGGGGSIGWRIKSYNQLRAEQPSITKGAAWQASRNTDTGVWQRWLGEQLVPGQDYWIQFKMRFNQPYLMRWGGLGPKVWGMDAGCRDIAGVRVPTGCTIEAVGPNMGTAMSMELTAATKNWHRIADLGANAWTTPYMDLYQGSTQFALSRGLTPYVANPTLGTEFMEQNGPTMWSWNGSQMVNTCDSGNRRTDALGQVNRCKTYGNPDTWHTVTIRLRPSGDLYDTSPNVTGKSFKHNTLLQVWYDGVLTHDFDPTAGPHRPGAWTQQQCQATQGWTENIPHDYCRTGIDLIRDAREVPPNSEWPVASTGITDPGSTMSQFILWTFSYPRGHITTEEFCENELTPLDPAYGQCKAALFYQAINGDPTYRAAFQDYLTHSEARINFDDFIWATAPLIDLTPPPTDPVPAPYQIDAANIQNAPVMAMQRVWFGPNKTFYNTTVPSNLVNVSDDATMAACTNAVTEIPISINTPLGGGYHATIYGNGKIIYFGGGHGGYRANRVNEMDIATGRWSTSQYVPDMGCQLGGSALGGALPTPPGIGCVADANRCAFGGTPNGSTGGRGWWEHMDYRYAWDHRLNGWMMLQRSGTWLYRHTDETWTLLRAGNPDPKVSMVCGSGDYTKANIVWNAVTNSMWQWCSQDHVFEWDYVASDWVYRHSKTVNRNPQTDVLSQAVVTNNGDIYMYEQYAMAGTFYPATRLDPMITRYNRVTGEFTVLDRTKPNHPQGKKVAQSIETQALDPNDPCYPVNVVKCMANGTSLAYDPIDNALLVLGKAEGTWQAFFWRLKNPENPASQWEVITMPTAPLMYGHDASLSPPFTQGATVYVPSKDAFFLFLRWGSQVGGASVENNHICADGAPGINGNCFKAWAFRLPRN